MNLIESFVNFLENFKDEVGFEPTVFFNTPVFKTGTLSRSAIHPFLKKILYKYMQNSLQILNHIEELKYRCFYFLLSFFLSFCSLYFFLGESTYILIYPLLQDLKNQINFLIYTDISEAFFASLKS